MATLEKGDRVVVHVGVPLRGYHGDCRTGEVVGPQGHAGGGVVLRMDEPNGSGSDVAGPFYPSEYELLERAPVTLASKLARAKSLAQEVLEEYPEAAHGSAWLEQAIGLMGRCEDELVITITLLSLQP